MPREFIQKLTYLVEASLANEKFGPEDLAREAGMSHTHLNRKLKSISNQNASQFIREIRLKKAKELLLNEDLTVAEISYMVGFGSPTYFNKCFHEYYGYPPGEVGKRHLSEPVSIEQAIDAKQVKISKRYGIALLLFILFAIISLTALYSVYNTFSGGKNKLEKTIAVLPFIDYSPEAGNTYIINGLQEEILDKLEKIQDLKVKSRTSVEKYKDTKFGIQEIANDLKVNYVLEGSGQNVNGRIRLRLQLIETVSGNHLWSKPYEEEVNNETIFDIQEEVALSVANELKVIIKPEEKDRLIKKPTQNLTAYNFYLRGLDYLNIWNYTGSMEGVIEAKQYFEQAVKLDSTFSEAYVRLGHIYIDLLYNFTQDRSIQRLYLDSGMMMSKKAFLYDTNNNWAYSLRGTYYYRTGMVEKANENFDKAFKLSPQNDYLKFYARFWQLKEMEDYANALKYYYQGKELQPKEILTQPGLLLNVSECLAYLGYPEISRKYLEEFLKQTNDSLPYFYCMAEVERSSGNFKNAVIFDLKRHEMDTTKTASLSNLIFDQLLCRNYTSAYQYLVALENEYLKSGKEFIPDQFSGYLYLKNGELKKADYHLNGSAKEFLKDIESNGISAQQFYSYWNLAKIYSTRGEKRKAFENLKMLKKRKTNYVWLVTYFKHLPLLDNMRNEPEFDEILKDVEAKYQAEHERVRKWLVNRGEF